MSPFSESTNGYGGCWRCLVVVLSIAFYCRVPFSAANRVMVANAFWNTDSVNVRRGVNLTLVCHLELGDDFGGVVGGPPVFRIVHSHADRTLLVADNDNITSAFARLGRYKVTYTPPPTDGSTSSHDGRVRFAQIVVKINGVQGEDSGTMACQQLYNDEQIGYCDIHVYAAVDEIFITAISPSSPSSPSSSIGNDATRVPNGSDVVLRESLDGAGLPSSTGVGCTAIINRGGHHTIPPLVSVIVVVGADGDDAVNATSWFQSMVETRQTVTDSGLSVYSIVSRLVFVPDRPDAELNGRTIKCIARSEGFNDERQAAVATARLVVNYIPAILCPSSNVTATVGSDATFTCTVKSNPVSEITWSAVVGADELYDVNGDSSVRFNSKAVSEDEVDISLTIVNVQPHHFRIFKIRAVNVIGDVTTGVKLVPGFDLVMVTEQEPTTIAEVVIATTEDAVSPVVVTAMIGVKGQAEAEVDFATDPETEPASDEQVHVEVERVPDRLHSMQNDAAVVSGDDDKLTTRSSQPVQSTIPTASINSAMPVRSMDSMASSTNSLSNNPCASYLTRFSLTLVSLIAFTIPRLTALRLFVYDKCL